MKPATNHNRQENA